MIFKENLIWLQQNHMKVLNVPELLKSLISRLICGSSKNLPFNFLAGIYFVTTFEVHKKLFFNFTMLPIASETSAFL